tara:strand:- start:684 stop:854 length:171 start_codon:yes stop_codon:yes gene_type:complete
MYKISEQMLKEIYTCLVLSQLNHRALSYIDKENNKIKIRGIQEKLEKEYPLITEKK